MTYLPRSITSSLDLARLLNGTDPATEEDAAETPLEWGGLSLFGGESYEIDQDASSTTRCVLAGVNAAVEHVAGGYDHACPLYRAAEAVRPHWCPVQYSEVTYLDGEAVVVLDGYQVYLGHGSHSETEVFADLDQARRSYAEQCAWMEGYAAELTEQQELQEAEDAGIEARAAGSLPYVECES